MGLYISRLIIDASNKFDKKREILLSDEQRKDIASKRLLRFDKKIIIQKKPIVQYKKSEERRYNEIMDGWRN